MATEGGGSGGGQSPLGVDAPRVASRVPPTLRSLRSGTPTANNRRDREGNEKVGSLTGAGSNTSIAAPAAVIKGRQNQRQHQRQCQCHPWRSAAFGTDCIHTIGICNRSRSPVADGRGSEAKRIRRALIPPMASVVILFFLALLV